MVGWLGGWSGRDDPPLDLQWSCAWVKVLGVFLGPFGLEEENWTPRIAAVENYLKAWRLWRLSFRERAIVINTLALSRNWYVASLIPMPDWVIESVQLKVWALHIQWGGRFVRRFSAWMQFLFIILVWCMARRQVKSCVTRDALILVPCFPFIRQSCLPGWPWMGVLFSC